MQISSLFEITGEDIKLKQQQAYDKLKKKTIKTMPKYTETKIKRIKNRFLMELEKSGGLIFIALKNTGIAKNTYYNWKKDDNTFVDAIDEVQERINDRVESKLFELIENNNVNAILFFCKTRMKNRGYGDRVELDGKIEHHHQQLMINVVDQETKDLMENMQRKIELENRKDDVDFIIK